MACAVDETTGGEAEAAGYPVPEVEDACDAGGDVDVEFDMCTATAGFAAGQIVECFLQEGGRDDGVGVDEDEIASFGMFGAGVARAGNLVAVFEDDFGACRVTDVGGAIG